MNLDKAILTLNAYERSSAESSIAPRALLLVSLAYIVAVVSVPVLAPGRLIWFFCYPIIMAEACGIGYGRLFMQSLWILPLLILIGIFNPLTDRVVAFSVYGFAVTQGWLSFLSLTLRGLLTFQALLILIRSCGFRGICAALARMGVPDILVTQLLMVYRFMGVILNEALAMHRSRVSRGFGRKSYPLKMWGVFIGQLLMRSIHRARRVNNAMLARGFNEASILSQTPKKPFVTKDYLFIILWIALFVTLRFIPLNLF